MTEFRAIAFYSAEAPEKERYVAFLYQPTRPSAKQIANGITSTPDKRRSMVFPSASKAGAMRSAEAWIAEERAKEARKREAAAKRDEARRSGRTPHGAAV